MTSITQREGVHSRIVRAWIGDPSWRACLHVRRLIHRGFWARHLVLFVALLFGFSLYALEVYEISSDVTGGIDLLSMSDTYYTDRLKGCANCTISGVITHSAVTREMPFCLMGGHSAPTCFNPSTKLDTIPLRIVDGGSWKYQANDGGNANYRIGEGYGSLEMERGSFEANAILLYGKPGANRSVLSVTNGCSLRIGTTIRVGLEEGGSAGASLLLDGGQITAYTVLELGRGPKDGTAPCNDAVNTVLVSRATLNLTAENNENRVYMGRWGANNGSDRLTDRNVIILGEDGVLHAKSIARCRDPRGHMIFRGGRFESFERGDSANSTALIENKDYGTFEIEGDGAPIRMYADYDVNFASEYCDGTSSVLLTGDGGFEKLGTGTLTLNNPWNVVKSSFSGGVIVSCGTLKLGADGMIPESNALSVGEGAVFDMNGYAAGFSAVTGAGSVTNGSQTVATLRLNYGDGASGFSMKVDGKVLLKKMGAGVLTISGSASNNACDLEVAEGVVVFEDRVSSTYGTVTVRTGSTLDISKCDFSCVKLVKEKGARVIRNRGLIFVVR